MKHPPNPDQLSLWSDEPDPPVPAARPMVQPADSPAAHPQAAPPRPASAPAPPAVPTAPITTNAASDDAPLQAIGEPVQTLADGLARHARRWATAHGADATTADCAARAAHALSLATSDGHVCIGLAQLDEAAAPEDSSPQLGPVTWRQRLLASGVVGTPAQPRACPLLLDDEDRLYLHRDFALERRLARRLVTTLMAPPEALPAGIAARTDATPGEVDGASLAAALALRGRLTIVSGGPGTGKTTAVVRLLGLLLMQAPASRIALAAPTGKAAARMTEAIRERAAGLPPALQALLPTSASTLHRLLGVSPAARGGPGEGFVHHAGHPLAIDVLVVDEASMLDLALAARVFDAVPPQARIILLGDQDQLAAVESGAVFAELSADPGLSPDCIADLARACAVDPAAIPTPPARAPTGLRDAVVWFDRNFRFAADSGIGRLAGAIKAGDAAAALDGLAATAADTAGDRSPALPVRWLRDAAPTPLRTTDEVLTQCYAAYLAAVQALSADQATAAEVLQAFDRFRVLAALRAGPRGVAALNQRLGRWARTRLGPRLDAAPRSPWYPGRPVMVLRNDPLLGLYNGDIGITLPAPEAGPGAIAVHFADAANGLRAFAPVRLPEHTDAWAMTVHQAQGSEFAAIALVLPALPHRVLSRELLYTAVTRAREQVTLIGSAPVIAAAIAAPTRRRSGLVSRVQEALAEAAARPPFAAHTERS